jgi:diguanylate cyclase (GGDEF)-like protein
MNDPVLDDVRSDDPVERLMEDSWTSRSRRRMGRREMVVETIAAVLFFCCAIPLALVAPNEPPMEPLLAMTLVVMYALASRLVKFPIGAGYVVPSYLVLVPMLLLLPPGTVPLLAAGGIALGTLGQVALERVGPERVLFRTPDAWHAIGPAVVLVIAGTSHEPVELAAIYIAAFVSGCLLDLISATTREAAILGVRPQVQARVIAQVWLIDACVAPLGLLIAGAARHDPREVLLILPLIALLLLASRDRSARIERAQRRLELVARERSRLQTAVRRLGDALAAKLDLKALTDIVLRGSIEALDADAGRLTLGGALGGLQPRELEIGGTPSVGEALRRAAELANTDGEACQLERAGVWALALPFGFSSNRGKASGALVVARKGRAFGDDEEAVVHGLVERARQAAADIVAHQLLREQALTDALTKLGNRRKLAADLERQLPIASDSNPLVLILFDLDGFKRYNDTFGHLAGDAMLARLGNKLAAATADTGAAYRLGGDEFCVLMPAQSEELCNVVVHAAAALEEQGDDFAVGASYGAVLLPHEATDLDYAMQLADERMYALKRVRSPATADQTRDVLLQIMHAKQPELQDHSSQVANLCRLVARRFGMTVEEVDRMVRAAELHDIGKVGIPDAILDKPGRLDEAEWESMRQHTLLGERILSVAPTLRPVGEIVRATHERWDGDGYPDGLRGDEIPLAARIIAACDTYSVMTSDRSYRARVDHDTACGELRRQAGHQLDPQVVDALLEALDSAGIAAAVTDDGALDDERPADEVVAYLRDALARNGGDRREQDERREDGERRDEDNRRQSTDRRDAGDRVELKAS